VPLAAQHRKGARISIRQTRLYSTSTLLRAWAMATTISLNSAPAIRVAGLGEQTQRVYAWDAALLD